jgi:hypothetical protein
MMDLKDLLFLVGSYLLDILINYHAQNIGMTRESNAMPLSIISIVMKVLALMVVAKFARISMLNQTLVHFAEGQIKTNIKIA